jgi:hypothetical protein
MEQKQRQGLVGQRVILGKFEVKRGEFSVVASTPTSEKAKAKT